MHLWTETAFVAGCPHLINYYSGPLFEHVYQEIKNEWEKVRSAIECPVQVPKHKSI